MIESYWSYCQLPVAMGSESAEAATCELVPTLPNAGTIAVAKRIAATVASKAIVVVRLLWIPILEMFLIRFKKYQIMI